MRKPFGKWIGWKPFFQPITHSIYGYYLIILILLPDILCMYTLFAVSKDCYFARTPTKCKITKENRNYFIPTAFEFTITYLKIYWVKQNAKALYNIIVWQLPCRFYYIHMHAYDIKITNLQPPAWEKPLSSTWLPLSSVCLCQWRKRMTEDWVKPLYQYKYQGRTRRMIVIEVKLQRMNYDNNWGPDRLGTGENWGWILGNGWLYVQHS